MKPYSRISLFPTFAQIAHMNYAKLLQLETQINQFKSLEAKSEEEVHALFSEEVPIKVEADQVALIIIVFTSLALEAYIYDYGARKTSDSFIQKYIDKLDLVSKWVIIPQLTTGKEFPRDGIGFELLKKLTRIRNSIVHFKSYDVSSAQLEEISRESDGVLIDSAKEAIRALEEVANEISRLDNDDYTYRLLMHER